MTHYDEMLVHLVKLASKPGSKDHGWFEAKRLAKCESGLWVGIDRELVEAMRSRSESPSKQSAPSTPASTTMSAPGEFARNVKRRPG